MFTKSLTIIGVILGSSTLCRGDELTFEKDIRPIFRAHCFDCHGAEKEMEGGLDLRLVRSIKIGGESGSAIDLNSTNDSLLLQRIKSGEMPPTEHPVPADQIATIERWIRAGAITSRPEPATIGDGLGISAEERSYWAFQSIQRSSVPEIQNVNRVRTPIDAFLLARMEPMGMSFADDAEKATQIRRAYLDLIGLPPTPEQVEAFLADDRDDAWDRLINELLDSPHYGERWGRHWLDVTGYADSEGATNQDPERPWSFKYRDWVIRAFNQDMPFDEFIIWQLAGDELAERPFKNMSSRQIDMLTATGFLRMAADGTSATNDEQTRNQVMTDTIKIVSSALLGLSVGCAQCHDHRYDPISQVDYYRLRAVLEPAINYKSWTPPAKRRLSLFTDEDIASSKAIEAEAAVLSKQRQKQQSEYMELALQAELAQADESIRKRLEEAYRTAGDQRTAEQKSLLDKYPNIGKLHPGVLYQYNKANADKLKKLDGEIAKIRSRKPSEEFLRIATEPIEDQPPITSLFYRGDYRQPKQPVTAGGLTVAAPKESPFSIAENNPKLASTGRRLAYARWLTSGRHPLVARVLVNRIWLHHFGQTFVSTPDEFGKLGSLPTHPQLLDWLADEFMSKGWSLKHLHRLILSSTVYRQRSVASNLARKIDSSNQWYSHFPVHRLEAEVIRDSMLFVSGRLDPTALGPAVKVVSDDTGQIISKGSRQRRSVYLQVRRTQPVALLKSFDAPVMEVNCGKRESSTVATQSLMLMNSDFVLMFSKAFAERLKPVLAQNPNNQNPNNALTHGWRLAYGRTPNADELALANEYFAEQCKLLEAKKAESVQVQALTNYCQALLTSNEFLYID
ncbi:MAG: DUF1553 domain-containing protein [Planctomycetaceae bacterium]|nr:DUF1553 domain-containing protein [Planctomycetaceae bacterium]